MYAAVLEELKNQLRRVLQQGTENIHKVQVELRYATADPKLQSDGMAASNGDCGSIQISSCLTGVFLFMLSEKSSEMENHQVIGDNWRACYSSLLQKYLNFDKPG